MTVWISCRIPKELFTRLSRLQKVMSNQSQEKVTVSRAVLKVMEKGLEALNQ